ncbi:MAG: DUF6174 domain-containing protein [Anaerolineae bacterium]|nr:DUF6174 domain-containing protein [Anaerolineae bacterium]
MANSRLHVHRRLFVASLWLIVIFLTVALTLTHDPPAELEASATRWAEQQPSRYRYTLTINRFGSAPTLTVAVEDGKASYPRVAEGASTPLPEDPTAYTVDWLFAQVEAELDRGATITHSRYNQRYGYPIEVSLDYDDSHDRWVSYAVSGMTILD